MPKSDIIVVGASAGGVEALRVLAGGFPTDLGAAVFVVLHIGGGPSALDEILASAGPLPAKRPKNGEEIRGGTIYVAPPDYHLLLADGVVRLSHGPKEHHTRPAINPLFRSAAHAYDGRATGVILSGTLDDGVAGLAEIKRCGGLAIAQDPKTALFPDMPKNAIKHVPVDHVLEIHQIPRLISKLAATERTAMKTEESIERKVVEMTCPDCGGPIWEERQGKIVEYRCRVGHAYSPLAMLAGHHETAEQALWKTVVALKTAADLAEHLAPELGTQATEGARKKRQQAAVIEQMLE